MRAQGVRYAGGAKQASTAAYAVTRRIHPSTGSTISMRHWNSLVREVRGAREGRVLISSEFFAGASDEQAAKIINDLDPTRVHVAVTLRPLASILASRWQQNVQEGARIRYEAWLHEVLEQPSSDHAKRFWSRQRHDALIRRWTAAAGADHVTAIIVNQSKPDALLRTFEELLGLSAKTLLPQHENSNRSMTVEEIEAVRAFNEQFSGEHFSKALHYKLMARGAALHMKARVPDAAEARLVTPAWATERANQFGAEVARSLRELGVNVIGDLESLVVPLPAGGAPNGSPSGVTTVTPEVAARMAMGVLLASGRARGERGPGKGRLGSTWSEPAELFQVRTAELIGTVLRRIWSGGVEKIAGLFERHEPPRR